MNHHSHRLGRAVALAIPLAVAGAFVFVTALGPKLGFRGDELGIWGVVFGLLFGFRGDELGIWGVVFGLLFGASFPPAMRWTRRLVRDLQPGPRAEPRRRGGQHGGMIAANGGIGIDDTILLPHSCHDPAD